MSVVVDIDDKDLTLTKEEEVILEEIVNVQVDRDMLAAKVYCAWVTGFVVIGMAITLILVKYAT